MKYLFTVAGICLLHIISLSQGFGVDTVYKDIHKTTTSITPPHEYFQLFNYSGDDIHMRWKVNQHYTFYPSQWGIAIQDNVTYHNPAPDSADFLLPAVTGAMDKIIINVFTNSTPGHGVFAVDLINLDSTAQQITVLFDIYITVATSISETENSFIELFPNPFTEVITFSANQGLPSPLLIDLYTMDGRHCIQSSVSSGSLSQELNLSDLLPGLYLVKISGYNTDFVTYRTIIKN